MSPNPLIIRYLFWILPIIATLSAAEPGPAALATGFDPEQGFKPAQRNFQDIALQLAASLEAYGTPANYLRHVNSEAKRVEALWLKTKGKPSTFRPSYFTEQYIEKLITGWNQMAPVLALESFSRNSGRQMRGAIMGSWNMTPAELAAAETTLTKSQSAEFQRLLAKPFFTKGDFQALEKFYADGNGYDGLSDVSKGELSKRIWRGTLSPEKRDADIQAQKGGTIALSLLLDHQKKTIAGIGGNGAGTSADDLRKAIISRLKLDQPSTDTEKMPSVERDAVIYSHAIRFYAKRRLKEISTRASAEQTQAMDAAMKLMFQNLVVAAQLEFETGLWEEVLKR